VALADILSAVQREGDEEIARITAERDESVAAIGREARRLRAEAEAAAAISRDAALVTEAEVIRHRAELHVERRLQETREAVFQEILGRARDRLSRYRSDPDYPATLTALLRECLVFLGEIETVAVDPRDVDLVSRALDAAGVAAKVESSLETWGGMVAGDGKGAFVRNTLEERLGRAAMELRRQIGDLVPGLRGGEPGGAS
jgi:vacuolar-type H+-ATPase subunit E/Vma4